MLPVGESHFTTSLTDRRTTSRTTHKIENLRSKGPSTTTHTAPWDVYLRAASDSGTPRSHDAPFVPPKDSVALRFPEKSIRDSRARKASRLHNSVAYPEYNGTKRAGIFVMEFRESHNTWLRTRKPGRNYLFFLYLHMAFLQSAPRCMFI